MLAVAGNYSLLSLFQVPISSQNLSDVFSCRFLCFLKVSDDDREGKYQSLSFMECGVPLFGYFWLYSVCYLD